MRGEGRGDPSLLNSDPSQDEATLGRERGCPGNKSMSIEIFKAYSEEYVLLVIWLNNSKG